MIRSGMLPGQAHVAEQGTSQPQLPTGSSHQARPAIGSRWVARADRGPAEGLFEKAEGMLDGETPQVPTPQHAQVGWKRTADPGEPERPRWQLLVRQTLHLYAHDAERGLRCAGDVEIGPGIDLDCAVGDMLQLL